MSYQPNQREKERLRRGRVTPIVPYTGRSVVNTQQFIQPQRQSGIPMGGSRTEITNTPEYEAQSGGLGGGYEGLMAAKESYDQVNKAYTGGQNAQDWYKTAGDSGLSPQERLEDTYGMFRDFATGEDSYSNAEMFSSRMANANRGMEGAPTQFDGFNTGFERPPPVPNNGLYANSATPGASVLPGGQNMGFGVSGAGQMLPQASGVSGLNAAPSVGSFTTGMPTDLSSVPLTMPTETLSMGGLGGEVAAEGSAAAADGGSMAGKAGAGLGVALNAYDMSQNGINAGNAMGLVGSGILLSVGAANAWNPVGWALLAGSAAYSLFG
jgi:hypothetical protein